MPCTDENFVCRVYAVAEMFANLSPQPREVYHEPGKTSVRQGHDVALDQRLAVNREQRLRHAVGEQGDGELGKVHLVAAKLPEWLGRNLLARGRC